MILTDHQPVYLPWLGLFHKIALADEYVFLDTVQYLKRDWNNRNKIKTPQGDLWLTVPVRSAGQFEQKLTDVLIDNTQDWRKKHWRAFEMSYGKAPFWDRYASFLGDLYQREWTHLNDLNETIFRYLLEALHLNPRIHLARDLHLQGEKSDLMLDMCRQLGADVFVFGALGRDYADVESFQRAGIQVVFQDYRHPVYRQLWGSFASHLTVFDLLFNCGDDSHDILLSGNTSRQEMLDRLAGPGLAA